MKTRKALQIILIIISAFLLLSGTASPQDGKKADNSIQITAAQNTPAELDSYLKTTIAAQNFVALGACLIKNNRTVWENCYGYSDLEAKKAVKLNDIYQIASLSKTVTATALMQLYEKGLFKLDDDVNNYLPMKVRNPNFPEKPITFRMLLTHTGGFEDLKPMGNKISMGVWGDSPISLSGYVEGLFTPGGKYYSTEYFSKINAPGTKYEYSNIAFSLIGYLVEKLSGKDFSDYCKENIFKPLEMHDTGWHLRDVDSGRVIFTYGFPKPDSTANYQKIKPFGTPGYPEGNLRTTMSDFVNFITAYIHNGKFKDYQLLKPETVDLMLSPQGIKNIPSRSFPVRDIGLTWLIFDVEGEPLYSMNGFSGSIFTNTYFSRENGSAIIYYYTGISMKNMQAMPEIAKKLHKALKTMQISE